MRCIANIPINLSLHVVGSAEELAQDNRLSAYRYMFANLQWYQSQGMIAMYFLCRSHPVSHAGKKTPKLKSKS